MNGWRVVRHNGQEYAQCDGMRFKCCRKNKRVVAPESWVWIDDIKRYVCPKWHGKSFR